MSREYLTFDLSRADILQKMLIVLTLIDSHLTTYLAWTSYKKYLSCWLLLTFTLDLSRANISQKILVVRVLVDSSFRDLSRACWWQKIYVVRVPYPRHIARDHPTKNTSRGSTCWPEFSRSILLGHLTKNISRDGKNMCRESTLPSTYRARTSYKKC